MPRVVAACCYTLAAGGLEAEGIFKAEADAAAVDFCAAQIGGGPRGAALPPVAHDLCAVRHCYPPSGPKALPGPLHYVQRGALPPPVGLSY